MGQRLKVCLSQKTEAKALLTQSIEISKEFKN
ncbi:Hypothetical protein Bdt_3607 [Bdellovibrio bacteriovorus str. Tiberius]|uniref:Uncharacterized protein n=1 Tax=Bdellovibrio bacteriovorus str. Tiberius TaxID=1069642 RepID=K7ZHA4_BDEBC|nr:Hypothetical protein Bdt_3607 [Bdellovibrio bacteriovorus str. Tiberius]